METRKQQLPGQGEPSDVLKRFGSSLRQRPRRLLFFLTVPFLAYFLFLRHSPDRIPFHYPLGPPPANISLTRQIPPYVHYVYGLSPTFGGRPFAFMQYLCMMSALRVLKPEIIYFHHVYEPSGWYWEQWKKAVSESGTTRLELVKQRDVTEVFGNPVEHFAHKADVLRLEVLRDYGGVYLDVDVLVIKDLASLYRHEMVMAMESQPNLDPKLPPSGLCNAIMLSKPHSSFVDRWIGTYRTFSKDVWAQHSVATPWALAQEYPTEITVLNKFAFFWPLWHDDHLRLVHRTTSFSFHSPSPLAPTRDTQFAYHLWESADEAERYLGLYDPDRIHTRGAKKGEEREEDGASDENAFSREGRQWISERFRKEWREAKKRGEV